MQEVEDKVKPAQLDEIVHQYIRLRDKKAELVEAHKKELEPYNSAMDKCEAYLLNTLNGMGAESIRTPYGTPYIKTATSATVADWPMVLNFIQKNDLWPMLERRVSKTVVEAYKEEHNDLPPGINWTETRVLNIRRN